MYKKNDSHFFKNAGIFIIDYYSILLENFRVQSGAEEETGLTVLSTTSKTNGYQYFHQCNDSSSISFIYFISSIFIYVYSRFDKKTPAHSKIYFSFLLHWFARYHVMA